MDSFTKTIRKFSGSRKNPAKHLILFRDGEHILVKRDTFEEVAKIEEGKISSKLAQGFELACI